VPSALSLNTTRGLAFPLLREVTSCRAIAVNSHLTILQVRSGIVARNVTPDIDVSEGFTALVYSSSVRAHIVTAGKAREVASAIKMT